MEYEGEHEIPPVPIALFNAKVPSDGSIYDHLDAEDAFPGPDSPYRIRISMAAIDPASGPATGAKPSTLYVVRRVFPTMPYGMDSDEEDDDDEEELPTLVNTEKNSQQAKTNGDSKVVGEDEDSEEDSEADSSDEEYNEERFILCTLDPSKGYQQRLDITINPDEGVAFCVSGDYEVHLTGNYILAPDLMSESEDDDDYDSDDEDQMYSANMIGEDSEDEEMVDGLDALADPPRITEVHSDDDGKTKKLKRAAPSSDDEDSDDEGPSKSVAEALKEATKKPEAKTEDAVNGGKPLSKSQKKKLAKKLKAANGAAVAVQTDANTAANSTQTKKVQFAKELEQGPTPSPARSKVEGENVKKENDKPASQKPAPTKLPGGLIVEDRKPGSGPKAKAGDNVGLRYIGKLANGKEFDSNKKGPPFKFKIGAGQVIKGWDLGIVGMQKEGTRKIVIPPTLAYGNTGAPPAIPPGSTLTFEVKLMSINGS